MSLIECPECKKQISDKAKACIGCGFPILLISATCPECGEQISGKDKSCIGCGFPLPLTSAESFVACEQNIKTSTIESVIEPTTLETPSRTQDSDSEFSVSKAIIGLFFGGAIGMALGIRWGFGSIGALFISIGCALGCGFNNWVTTNGIILGGIVCVFFIFIVSIFN